VDVVVSVQALEHRRRATAGNCAGPRSPRR
jgi:hypothetical protein